MFEAAEPKISIITNQERFPKSEMEKALSSYSSISSFDDNKWIIDKLSLDENRTNKQRSIYFGKFNNNGLLYECKEWALKLLLQRRAIKSISESVRFIRNCDKAINSQSFGSLEEKDILNIYSLIFNNEKIVIKSRLENWLNLKYLLKALEYHKQYFIMEKFTTPSFPDKKKNENKYIPEEAIVLLDKILKTSKDIPLAYRVIYWTLRLIPNRIMEVLSMTTNCLKTIDEKTYILSIPTFKQSGTFSTGTLKLVEIQNEGIGAYYIQILKEQIDMVKNVYKPDDDYLFYKNSYFLRPSSENHEKKTITNKKSNPKKISTDSVNRFLKTMCQDYSIKDKDGNSIIVTSHQFRHNGISDRMNSGIFRAIDITGLTKHHNTKMIEETYTHTSKSELKKASPIVFRGRIVNTNNDTKLNKILSNPYAKRIHNLGVCSDIRACSKDKSQCLKCEFMIPNVDDLDFYKEEIKDWKNKKKSAINIGNEDFSDLCQYWIESYEIIINKIITTLTDEYINLKLEE